MVRNGMGKIGWRRKLASRGDGANRSRGVFCRGRGRWGRRRGAGGKNETRNSKLEIGKVKRRGTEVHHYDGRGKSSRGGGQKSGGRWYPRAWRGFAGRRTWHSWIASRRTQGSWVESRASGG